MAEIETLARKWGNSLAVIIPANIAEEERIHENQELIVTVKPRRPKAGVLWGFAKDWKRPTIEIKNEARAGWMSETDRKEEEAWRAKQAKK